MLTASEFYTKVYTEVCYDHISYMKFAEAYAAYVRDYQK